ncbi:MAG: peptide chain release factor 2 [Elusimicrobia bacterium RIFOXYB2_FULL_48_7]|nr:MAG: peptide chain release factor 2 [Elusimicrobia bacterium RIFOXYB2_FULL_48_7]
MSGQSNFWDNTQEAQKIMQDLDLAKSDVASYENLKKEVSDLETIIELSEGDKLDGHFEQEFLDKLAQLKKDSALIETRTKLSLPQDKLGAIVSIHAGAGGTEACDWAEMLFRMYARWAEKKGFKLEQSDMLPGDGAGIKSITFFVRGPYAYGLMKSESGVHRLVRISPFDANKRRHTSFASCDVLPEIEDEIKIEIKDEDIRIDTYRASGHGGQHLQKTDSAVRITHIPTGIVTQCQNERSQLKNKISAMKILKAKLYEVEQDKLRSQTEKHYSEKGSIGWANQIRSYVFMPYQLVKDHRTGAEIGNIQLVMDGDIDLFIEAYLAKNLQKT